MKRIVAIFSYTIDGARKKALELVNERVVIEERMNMESYEVPEIEIETDKEIYRL